MAVPAARAWPEERRETHLDPEQHGKPLRDALRQRHEPVLRERLAGLREEPADHAAVLDLARRDDLGGELLVEYRGRRLRRMPLELQPMRRRLHHAFGKHVAWTRVR